MVQALFDAIDIQGKDITVDALLTQRKFAEYLIQREAHYHFTVKGNQPTLEKDIRDVFENRQKPHYEVVSPPEHGRIETRRIWVTSTLNDYLDFPHVGQAYCIEREIIEKKTGEYSKEAVVGVTSRNKRMPLIIPHGPVHSNRLGCIH
jgi:hypothetical protein